MCEGCQIDRSSRNPKKNPSPHNRIVTRRKSGQPVRLPSREEIIRKAEDEGLELMTLDKFESITGRGIKGEIEGQSTILIGNRKLMDEGKIEYAAFELELTRLEEEAKTTMLVSLNNKIVGLIAEADTLKEDSIEAITQLEEMGFLTVMLTGDNRRTGEAIAQKAGISRVLAEVLPDQKVAEILLFFANPIINLKFYLKLVLVFEVLLL